MQPTQATGCDNGYNISHLTRKAIKARSSATRERIRSHVRRERRYRPPPGGELRKRLGRARKELAGRFYQLLSGHTATAVHLRRVGQVPSDRCWWCGSGEVQSRHHLFTRCRRWTPEIKRLWESVEKDCEWECPRALSLPLHPRGASDPRPAGVPRGHEVGQMPGLALMGVAEDESELGEIDLWPQTGEDGWSGESEGGGGPGPP